MTDSMLAIWLMLGAIYAKEHFWVSVVLAVLSCLYAVLAGD